MPKPGRKPGRERVYDVKTTHEAILNAAEAVFAEHGFDGTSMDAIAQISGYNKSLLFQYFGNKLGLYTQVLKRADREMGELMGRVFSPVLEDETLASDADRFRDFLRSTCGAIFDYMVAHPKLMHLFNWEQAEGWQIFTRIASQFEPEDLTRFEALFLNARRAGLLRSDLDSVVMVVLIQQICWSALAALPLYQSLFAGRNAPSAAVLTHVREQIVAFLIAGMMGDSGARNWRKMALFRQGENIMHSEIGYIHHVGHVVRDIEKARELYQKLGFFCPAPAYPTLSRNAGEPAKPFGVANMHTTFARNFVEIVAVVTEESHLPDDARPNLLQIPPAALPRVIEGIERTIAKISASLARFEGLHILVFQTEDADESARRFDQTGVGHSGVNR